MNREIESFSKTRVAYPQLAMRICDRVLVVQRGEVVAAGSSAAVGTSPDFLDLLIV